MGIQSRSLIQQRFELLLERSNPLKLQLIRANPYNCTGGACFTNGRETISATCPVCAGTGYLGVSFSGNNRIVTATGQTYSDAAPPAATTYLIFGDLQTGHGLYGTGGDYLKLLADLGKQQVGDATLFTKMIDFDRQNGVAIYPIVSPTLPRPDRIISRDGVPYNIVKQLIAEIGMERICRIFTVENGSFTATLGNAGGSR